MCFGYMGVSFFFFWLLLLLSLEDYFIEIYMKILDSSRFLKILYLTHIKVLLKSLQVYLIDMDFLYIFLNIKLFL